MSGRARLVVALAAWLASMPLAAAQKFYPDDPLEREPPPAPTLDPKRRELSPLLELVGNTIGSPGERHPERGVIPAGGINTLGEVMDGPWFVNRHGRRRLTSEELRRGPGDETRPSHETPWQVRLVKPGGVRRGILVEDAERNLYLLRFDPPGHLEMATGAEVVGSKFFHALGYHVPENYVVVFERSQLAVGEGAESVTSFGSERDLVEDDIDFFLSRYATTPAGAYRAVATRIAADWSSLLGPFQLYGVRSDDPNDIVPHEHRRELRGLFVFNAWLNHVDFQSVNTMDVLVNDVGAPHVRHYLVDFSATLGSRGSAPKEAIDGNEPLLDSGHTLKNIAGMGLLAPRWMRARYPHGRSVGRLQSRDFEPKTWTPRSLPAPFANRLPDDTFWAAKRVMAFTDEDIATLVSTGRYSNPEAEAWIVKCLVERRDRIGRTYFGKVLPLDDFQVVDGRLTFRDLELVHGFAISRSYSAQWSAFDNVSESHRQIGIDERDLHVPPVVATAEAGSYFAARIVEVGGDSGKAVTVYLRKQAEGLAVVGVERDWPGKVLADPSKDVDMGSSRYVDLDPPQKGLFDDLASRYREQTGLDLTAQQAFDGLSISERTTFDAVTHALIHSELTGEEGEPLGTAIELVARVERIAGQYYGRAGDQQFRLYVDLVPRARDVLERSREFFRDHENTVYHVGYPESFRQIGSVPNVQFSVSEDGTKADIDVDYRSSRTPQALWNGHLTSTNSDVRAGNNHERHSSRWSGLVDWWREIFGKLPEKEGKRGPDLWTDPEERPTPLPPNRAPGTAIAELHDAAAEFLADWLVRGDVDEAMELVSPRTLACVDTDDDAEDEVLRNEAARRLLREAMEGLLDRLGDRDNLTEAIDAVLPWRESLRVRDHSFAGDFSLVEMTDRDASIYLCRASGREETVAEPRYGTYFATLFRFKMRDERGGVLGLLWVRESGFWRVVAYEAFEQ